MINLLNFCTSNAIHYQDIVKLIKKYVLQLSNEEIEKMYSLWQLKFNTEGEDSVHSRDIINSKLHVPHDACYLGIDLPTWIGSNISNSGTVMIVGIDPLRNKVAFKSRNILEDVIIGTPYALHKRKMREGKTKEYWKFLKLLGENYVIYLTDIYKVFYYRGNYKGNRSYNDKDLPRDYHLAILKEEIKIIQPKIIIALGALTAQSLLTFNVSPITKVRASLTTFSFERIPVIPMVHLSGGSYASHKKAYLETNGLHGSNIGELYYKIIENLLIQGSLMGISTPH